MSNQIRFLRFLLLILFAGISILGVFHAPKLTRARGIHVQGFLDDQERIKYHGGESADAEGYFFTFLSWPSTNRNATAEEGKYVAQATEQEIKYLAQASKRKAQQLLEQGVDKYHVRVTFRRYLPFGEFDAFRKQPGIIVKSFDGRILLPQVSPEERITFGGAPPGNKPMHEAVSAQSLIKDARKHVREIRAEQLSIERTARKEGISIEEARKRVDRMIIEDGLDYEDLLGKQEYKAIRVADNDVQLKGVFTCEVLATAEGFEQLVQDPRVMYIDLTSALVFQQLQSRGIQWEDFTRTLDIGGYDPFWDMETIGLEKFQAQ